MGAGSLNEKRFIALDMELIQDDTPEDLSETRKRLLNNARKLVRSGTKFTSYGNGVVNYFKVFIAKKFTLKRKLKPKRLEAKVIPGKFNYTQLFTYLRAYVSKYLSTYLLTRNLYEAMSNLFPKFNKVFAFLKLCMVT